MNRNAAVAAIVGALLLGVAIGYVARSPGPSIAASSPSPRLSESPSDSTSAPAVDESPSEEPTSATPTDQVALTPGDEGKNGDITFTLQSLERVAEYPKQRYSGGPVRPVAGATLYAAKITILNDGGKSISPYCGGRDDIRLVDDEGRQFDAMDNEYELKGNEEACTNLQPGFKSSGVYLFQLPAGARPQYVDLWDYGADGDNYEGSTYVRYEVSLA